MKFTRLIKNDEQTEYNKIQYYKMKEIKWRACEQKKKHVRLKDGDVARNGRSRVQRKDHEESG
jgi:hypothetical protein